MAFFTNRDFHMHNPKFAQHLSYLQHLKKVFHFSAAKTQNALWMMVENNGVNKFSNRERPFPQVIHSRLWA